jgi:HprK-related kinase A
MIAQDSVTPVGALSEIDFGRRLSGPGVGVRMGPFDIHMRIRVPGLAGPLYKLYRHYPWLDGERVFSTRVTMHAVRPLRSWGERKVRFLVDGRAPHEDMPFDHALAVLEWGINLVIAVRHQCYLMLHAAAVERGGNAMLLPASPGDGKTTLCAALAHRGWRLLSDEFGLIRPGRPCVLPLPRLMPLKNESIAVMRAFAPDAFVGPSIPGTRKGTVAHLRPPKESISRAGESAVPRWVVFPRWVGGSPLMLEPVARGEAFMQLATHAFNYEVLGEAAFEAVRGVIEQSDCYRLQYSDLEEAVGALTVLAARGGR